MTRLTSSSDNVLLQSLLVTWSSILTLSCWNVLAGLKAVTCERMRAVRDNLSVKCNSMVMRGVSITFLLLCPPCLKISEKLTC